MTELNNSGLADHTATSTQDERWMQHALLLAAKAEALGEVPVGAVVVKDGVIIGEGWNQPISGCDPSAHAEIMALRAAATCLQNYRLPGCQLYITIEPCTMCAGAIVHARIAEVIFAATEPKAGAVLSNGKVFDAEHLNHRVAYRFGVCSEQASSQIQAFFKRRRAELKAQRQAEKTITAPTSTNGD